MRNMNFECQGCGHKTSKWAGQCHHCKQWNSLDAINVSKEKRKKVVDITELPSPKSLDFLLSIKSESQSKNERLSTGITEFNQVLGDGIVRGSLTLLSGDPGIGKTTLMTQACCAVGASEATLYISGEESCEQVALRFQRVSKFNIPKYVKIIHETKWEVMKEIILQEKPKFLLIDSIQTTVITGDIFQKSFKSIGGVSQIKHVVFELMELAKKLNMAVFIIGHINKEGSVAGPKILEHMVDASLYLRELKGSHKRELIVLKNRFGSNMEVGLFTMTSGGLTAARSKGDFYLSRNGSDSLNTIGRAIVKLIVQGRRLSCEVQCLCVKNSVNATGVRVAQGVERGRFLTLVAIIEKYLNISLGEYDLYIEVSSPHYIKGLDLAVVASILSSFYEKTIPLRKDLNKLYPSELDLSGVFSSSDQEMKEDNQEHLESFLNFRNISELDKYIKELL